MKIYSDNLKEIFIEIENEVLRAKSKYPDDFNSTHEAYGVILEEMDEMWEEIKKKNFDSEKCRVEAIQTTAMLCRFLVEIL